MDYKLDRSNRKSLAIIIRDGKVIVKAPYHISLSTINDFVDSKKSWIDKKLKEYRAVGVDFKNQRVFLFGRLLKIYYSSSNKTSIKLHKNHLEVFKSKQITVKGIEAKIEKVFKRELKNRIDRSLTYYANALGINKPSYKIRKYKRIHGRCSRKGELAFNTYLYEHTEEFIDYVVLHELAHIFEFNHSQNFYKIIERHLPNYKEIIRQDKKVLSLHQDQ